MTLEVLDVRGIATVQDAGRPGWKRFGVPASGPMDAFAFHAANTLAGNPVGCALVEVGLGDITFQARQDGVVAVTGAGYRLSVYTWEFPLWDSFLLRAGWKLSLRKVHDGMWAYLAVSGGIQTSPVLGSRSTYMRGGFGGLDGRPLQVGDILQTGDPSRVPYELAARTLPEEARPNYSEHPIIDVIPGPQMELFVREGFQTFLSNEYSVSLTSDRMGCHLEGPPLMLDEKKELLSEGMAPGVIQVPPDGQPIVMMVDCPTTGGYPKIGTVVRADLPVLAQCVPNRSRIRFRETTVEQAQERYRALISGLDKIVEV